MALEKAKDHDVRKIGDKICVNPLPALDINGCKYEETGSGGTVIDVIGNMLIVELFDGIIIKVENDNYDLY